MRNRNYALLLTALAVAPALAQPVPPLPKFPTPPYPEEFGRSLASRGIDAHIALGCRDLSRVDMIIGDDGDLGEVQGSVARGKNGLSRALAMRPAAALSPFCRSG